MCVPGFARQFDEWYTTNKSFLSQIEAPSVQFSPQHWLNKHAIRISMRAGSIVIFDSREAHGAGPNNSSRMRCAQFIKMFVLHDFNKCILEPRRRVISKILRDTNFLEEVTPLGRIVFGLESPNLYLSQQLNALSNT
eukprot:TRINITY_DN4588_c0_g1_i2.p1 TRINITY_DN4588_c0_g1~~TRINITY_DN4588_c0_g1_i2.p1  ORF type:complete len:137 (+),score=20.86 TRINITY_DN4588_c0_g1_i2:1116-1526(+)